MIDTILSILSSIWKPVASIGGMIAAIFFLWRKNKKQAERLAKQEQVIRTHEAKEEVHKQDQTIDSQLDRRFEELRGKVDNAKTDSEAADVVSQSLNGYFRGDR